MKPIFDLDKLQKKNNFKKEKAKNSPFLLTSKDVKQHSKQKHIFLPLLCLNASNLNEGYRFK